MQGHLLQILSDRAGLDRWVLHRPIAPARHEQVDTADCDYATFADALNAGTIVLARAEDEPYENDAADPVGDANCNV